MKIGSSHSFVTISLLSLSFLSIVSPSQGQLIPPLRDVKPINLPSNIRIRPDVSGKLICQRDLATQAINFQIVNRSSPYRGTVEITGIVKNIGNQEFSSSPAQQMLYLYQDRQLVASQRFQNLASGETITIRFNRPWYSASPDEGEFPPTYKLIIGYDPDIALDNNPNNDDCNSQNNQLERAGSEINTLFRTSR